MRQLATIQKVSSLNPIVGADAIECAQVLGWSVIVRKGEFNVGDLAVFFEIDSFLSSSDPRYASFESRFINWDGKRGMRLKSIKLRGQLSQGLVLKVSDFPEIKNPTEGMDVTELLKIEKWEKIETGGNGGRIQGSGRMFPSFIPKTDQTRIQSLTSIVRNFLDDTFEVTMKLDGSSMTVFCVDKNSPYFEAAYKEQKKKIKGRLNKIIDKIKTFFKLEKKPDYISGICSRNLLLAEKDTSHFSECAKKNGIFDGLIYSGSNYALQGELIGPTIQDNHERVSDFEYHVYNVFDIDNQKYLMPTAAREFCRINSFKYVPVISESLRLESLNPQTLEARDIVDKILEYAEGPGMNKGVKREGLVFKSNKMPNLSFKAISNSYLLKTGK